MSFHFSPQQYIDYVCQVKNVSREDFNIADTVVITWFDHVFQRLTTACAATVPAQRIFGERLKTGKLGDTPVTIVHSPIGAPGTISLMEELIELGARKIIGFGYAGSLQSKAPIGSLIVPANCVSDEGTSRHYLSKIKGTRVEQTPLSPKSDTPLSAKAGNAVDIGTERSVERGISQDSTIGFERTLHRVEDAFADEKMKSMIVQATQAHGLEVHEGQHWTTDAIYRESTARIAELQTRGVLGVDMETSAMYAVGFVRNVRVCNALVVSDELFHDWTPGFSGDVLKSSKEKLEDALLEVLPLL